MAEMQRRTYLKIEPEKGKWYVSNPNTWLGAVGMEHSGVMRSQCVVGGPFADQDATHAWLASHREHALGAMVWQQLVG